MFELIEVVSGRLIGPIFWNFLETLCTVRISLGAVLGVCVVICETNCIVMCIRPEMTMKFGFTKWNRY